MSKIIISGKNSVLEACKNNLPVELIYLTKKENIGLFSQFNVLIKVVSNTYIETFTKENHQGFIAILEQLNYQDISYLSKRKPNCVLVLDRIQDPHNFGAIIRTANAAGIKDIIFPKTNSAQISQTVLKVSSGGFVNMNFYKVNSLSSTITKLKKNGYWAYATTLDKNSISYKEIIYNKPTLLIIGNEANGVSKSVLSVIDQSIHIQQFGTVQSLNASVATGIILFDFIQNEKRK
ncbi:23S rRNA (guanosine(2251)-2'-O)-methyltransferase RlmB [Mycoplasmopsis cricetuli]|uniref:23S rRNA (guanosine(2251)-2'-O)-methyltransferase RlmB n=1 Tax=Mycoplasmopsis cricetuli TaxID=171283 RepID=UPI000472690C|nr:23S rRNA (guanosine(2251)-2'-O)-methyltransferase RlmB [Mycoplasmopsis cricetuli]